MSCDSRSSRRRCSWCPARNWSSPPVRRGSWALPGPNCRTTDELDTWMTTIATGVARHAQAPDGPRGTWALNLVTHQHQLPAGRGPRGRRPAQAPGRDHRPGLAQAGDRDGEGVRRDRQSPTSSTSSSPTRRSPPASTASPASPRAPVVTPATCRRSPSSPRCATSSTGSSPSAAGSPTATASPARSPPAPIWSTSARGSSRPTRPGARAVQADGRRQRPGRPDRHRRDHGHPASWLRPSLVADGLDPDALTSRPRGTTTPPPAAPTAGRTSGPRVRACTRSARSSRSSGRRTAREGVRDRDRTVPPSRRSLSQQAVPQGRENLSIYRLAPLARPVSCSRGSQASV